MTDGTLNIGFKQDVQQNPIVNAIEVVALSTDVENPVDPSGALEAFAAQDDLFRGASYAEGVAGSAVLEIMTGNNNIQSSNFGANSFEVTNTGGKDISAIFIDVRTALYPDSVFDPDGLGGDSAAKPWQINSGGGTGAYVDGSGYFLPGVDPIPNSNGSGGASNGGFKGAMVKFTDFGANETAGFSGDMDPNSIAGMSKADVDGGAILSWDVGGISGHELIGSTFTVLFDDGSTATGQLASDGSSAGSHALATQGAASAGVPGLAVDGTLPGGTGTYGGDLPTVTVTGAPGDRVQITMTKGFNPVTETSNGIAGLVEDRLERYEFEASNAFDAQTVIVTIGADGTFDASSLFDYDDAVNNNVGSGSFAGDDVAQIGFVATKVEATGGSPLPIGPTTAPIYLTNEGGPVTGDPVDPPNPAGQVYLAQGGQVVMEAESADVSGTGWVFETVAEGANETPDPQGTGYIIWEGGNSFAGPASGSTLSYSFLTDENGEYTVKGMFGRRVEPDSTEANDLFLRMVDADGDALNPVPATSGSDTLLHVKTGEVVEVPTAQFDPANAPGGGRVVLNDADKWMKFYASGLGLNELDGGGSNGDNGGINVAYELEADTVYTLQIAGRSDDFEVDRLAISNDGAGSATSLAETGAESQVQGETGGGGGGGTPAGDLVIAIDSSADDWEERGGAGSADFEIGENGGPQWSALRFDDVDIPGAR